MSLTKKLASLKTDVYTQHDVFWQLEQDRKDWEVSQVLADTTHPQQEEINNCFSRLIALSLELELPVGSFIRALIEKQDDIPLTAYRGLVLNIEDEEKHFKAFQAISRAYRVNLADVEKSKSYRQRLVQIKTNPLIKSRDLETILFIPLQTVLRYYGSQSLERTVAMISLDEYRHIQYNWECSEALNINFDKEYENLILEIGYWAFEPLQTTQLSNEFWYDCMNELREIGECQRLQNLMNYGIHRSPFELSNATY